MVREFFVSGFSQSLEQLADRIDENTDPRRKKTTVRRLYDITNVLKALGLVKKTVNSDKNVIIEWQGMTSPDPRPRRPPRGRSQTLPAQWNRKSAPLWHT